MARPSTLLLVLASCKPVASFSGLAAPLLQALAQSTLLRQLIQRGEQSSQPTAIPSGSLELFLPLELAVAHLFLPGMCLGRCQCTFRLVVHLRTKSNDSALMILDVLPGAHHSICLVHPGEPKMAVREQQTG